MLCTQFAASLGAKANDKNIGNIIKYIGRLDADEYGAFVIKGAISKIPNPRQNKHLREWAENGGGAVAITLICSIELFFREKKMDAELKLLEAKQSY